MDRIDKRIKVADAELRELVAATGSTLLELTGIGPSGAARLLGDVGDISRFADKGRLERNIGIETQTMSEVDSPKRSASICPGNAILP